jgi:GTP pyrophosphokinase
MSPLLTELQNGDEVEIVRAEGQTPPAAWESLVVTGKARASIRRATRAAVRRQYTGSVARSWSAPSSGWASASAKRS